ncbi:hypothetical protein O0I10_007580 [Lichtheimia ornata]|uniref:Uncharacterized protein n=1 Tax=Lichtheimia ornata TaxID=688661 RepID=A0AAD7UZX3_9FUNG|nr:uncharacterized protein O0I10_007580 [Lichtheimia ornata]KAJ8656733.1 hypothetical protein O0I10_007580 [Lichtheimia ornata]
MSSSKVARLQKNWTSGEKPGDKSGDEAILEWLQTPRNAARFIRIWNNIAEADSKTSFSAELATFVNSISSPQRTASSIHKRAQRFDELLKETKAMLSNGASDRAILKHFPYYHECMKCMERGLEVIRQELDAKGEKDDYYDRIFEAYQSQITQRTRSERRSKSASLPDTPSPILPSRDTLFDMPPSPSSSSSSSSISMTKQPYMDSSMAKRPSIVSASSSSNVSNQISSSLKRKASQHPRVEYPPRPNKRGFRIESDSTSPSDSRLCVDPTLPTPTPSSSSSSSLAHQPPALSRPISSPRRPLHIRPDTPSSSKSIPSQQREQPKKKRVSHQQPRNHHAQQRSEMDDTETIPQELTQLLQETNKCMQRIMKINQRIEKRRLLVEKRKLALSRSREMERKADLIKTMLESGFSKEEISETINK